MTKFWMQQRGRASKISNLVEEFTLQMEARDPRAALDAARRLERLQPLEPRWPRLQGQLQCQLGDNAQAGSAYARATQTYEATGQTELASAMAKTLLLIDHTRVDALAAVDPAAARRFVDIYGARPMISIRPPRPVIADVA